MKKTVSVRSYYVNDGGDLCFDSYEVEAFVVGYFAVRRGPCRDDRWTIVHLPSGCTTRNAGWFRSEAAAIKAAMAIADVTDWSFVERDTLLSVRDEVRRIYKECGAVNALPKMPPETFITPLHGLNGYPPEPSP